MSKLYLVRGLPGSGKSTISKTLNCFHLEADMVITKDDSYNWKPDMVKFSHSFIKELAEKIMKVGSDIVISNIFTTIKEMQPYIDMANENGYKIIVIRCINDYGNTHNVPQESLDKMKNRFQDYDGETLTKGKNE